MLVRAGTSRGVVLVIALFMVLLLAMVARAILQVGPASMALSVNSEDQQVARRAAESGLAYARARLLENVNWRGDLNGITVRQQELTVLEDTGNVIGLLRGPDAQVSQFRIRFNYQDGQQGPDNLDDPAVLIDNRYVSVNNLTGQADVVVPRADAGTWKVSRPGQGPYKVPQRSVCLIVEGRAGPGLNQLTPADMAAPAGEGRVVSQTVEAVFQLVSGESVLDSPIMGGGDVTFNGDPRQSNSRVEVTSASAAPPRLRSKRGVKVTRGAANGTLKMSGEVGRDSAYGFQANTSGNLTFIDESVGDGRDFYNLKWSDVRTADADPNTSRAVQIPGGTYVHWGEDSVHYYDMTLDEYLAYMQDPANQDDPGVTLSRDLREVRTPTNLSKAGRRGIEVEEDRWEISQDLRIVASAGGRTEFNVIPRQGFQLDPADTAHLVPNQPDDEDVEFDLNACTVSGSSNMNLIGEMWGADATLTCEGKLTMLANEFEMEAGGGGGQEGGENQTGATDADQLNVYAKGDVLISTFRTRYRRGEFQSINFQGVVYTWGNFAAVAGAPGVNRWGDFNLEGCLVAYGADPASGTPGAKAGSGRIDVTARTSRLRFDAGQVVGLARPQSVPVKLQQTLYATH